MVWRKPLVIVKSILLLLALVTRMSAAFDACSISIVEKGTGWPVPLVELRTTHQVRLISDNAGIIALDLPELMDREVWFDVLSDGYEVPKDGFEMRGIRLKPARGKALKVEVTRTTPAKCLGRLTGGGIFAEVQKLGQELDWLESGAFGCDSVQNAVYHGKLFWAWGDTIVPNYPLGIFDMTSATTTLEPLKSFKPPVRLKYDYFVDNQNRPRGVARMPGSGPTWVSGYSTVKDRTGAERLVGTYVKIKPPLEAYELGLCVWSDSKAQFEQHRVLWRQTEAGLKQPPAPQGHPVLWTDEKGKDWLLFGNPLPNLRCPATFEAWENPDAWEVIKPQEELESGIDEHRIKPHSGSMAWNSFRRRWVTVFMEAFGRPSAFGELWYAEAKSPFGPWGKAVKVLSHQNYTFYNPRIHPEIVPEGSPILLFEGSYTIQFANHPAPTPRYDYTQILYRLDLDDPDLSAAQR